MTDEKIVIDHQSAPDAPEASMPGGAVPPSGAATDKPRKPPVEKNRRGNGALWLVLVILIAALAYAAWLALQAHARQQDQLTNLQQQLQEQQQALVAQRQSLEVDIDQQITQQQETLQEHLGEMAQRLENTNSRVLAMSSVNRNDWKLAEAEYLLRLANQRVLLERNSNNAVALAQTVDDILRNLNDPDLYPVRRALAEEMSELKLAGDIDREGVYLRLLALSQQLDKLSLIEPLGVNEDPWLLAEDELADPESLWTRFKRGANNILHKFSHHLRVRDHAQPVPAILPPDNRIYLKLNLRLMLEQAQSALLREEAQVYQASLEKAREWLVTYFPLNPQSVAAQAEISELQYVVITQSLPSFSESTTALKNYIERKHNSSAARAGGN